MHHLNARPFHLDTEKLLPGETLSNMPLGPEERTLENGVGYANNSEKADLSHTF
jgi:hypothetical protein